MKLVYTLSFLLFIVVTTSLADAVFEEGGSGGFQLLNRPAGVGAVGRGYSGVVSQETFARYYNPAMYSAIDKQNISFELMRQMSVSDLQSTQFELGFSVKKVFFAIEASNQTVGNIYLTDELPGGYPEDAAATSWQFSQFSLNIGVRSDENLSWGFTFATAFDRFDGEKAYALIFGAGITYSLLDSALLVGASAINWGLTTPMWGEGDETFGHGEGLPSSLRLGAGYTHYFGHVRLLATGDMVYTHVFQTRDSIETDIGNRFSAPLGIEVSPVEWATIRVGKKINGTSDIINFGLGFQNYWIQTDISFVIHAFGSTKELEWMAGVTLRLGNKKEKKSDKVLVDEPEIVLRDSSSEDSLVKNENDTIVVEESTDTVVATSLSQEGDSLSIDSLPVVDYPIAEVTPPLTDSVIQENPSNTQDSVVDTSQDTISLDNSEQEPVAAQEYQDESIENESQLPSNSSPTPAEETSPVNIDEELDLIE